MHTVEKKNTIYIKQINVYQFSETYQKQKWSKCWNYLQFINLLTFFLDIEKFWVIIGQPNVDKHEKNSIVQTSEYF